MNLIPVSDRVLVLAGELLPPDIRSLDAIQLATALLLGGDVGRVITYDERMAQAPARLMNARRLPKLSIVRSADESFQQVRGLIPFRDESGPPGPPGPGGFWSRSADAPAGSANLRLSRPQSRGNRRRR